MAENKNLLAIFKTLPENVREWLASERVTYSIIDLNKRLNITEERVKIIPRLILRLVTQDLNARDFVNTLAIKLNVSDSAAKIIAKEIETKILHQIEESLRVGAGVDVAMLHFGREVGEISQIEEDQISNIKYQKSEKEEGAQIPNIKYQKLEEGEPHIGAPEIERGAWNMEQKEGDKERAKNLKPLDEHAPFILHTEKEAVKPVVQPPRPTFSIKIPINQKKYTPSAQPLRQIPSVTARIETGEENQISKIKYQKSEEPERQITEEKRVPATLPPLRRIGDVENKSKSPIAIPKIIMPRPQVAQSDRRPTTEDRSVEEAKISPQIKKVVHYSQWLTPLD